MRNFIAGIFVGFCILAMFYFLFDGMAKTQEIREASVVEQQLARCGTGQHCKIGNKQMLVITSGGH